MSTTDHPSHYQAPNDPNRVYETIAIIDALGLDFTYGNALKYLLRAGKKSADTKLEDLNKAAWYVQHAIELTQKKSLIP